MSEWKEYKLGELCDFQSGTSFPITYQGETSGDYPFIKVSDMSLPGNEKVIRYANNWISEETRKKLQAKIHPKDAIVFAKIGVALTNNKRRLLQQPSVIDNNMMSAIAGENVTPLFLYYLLQTIDLKDIALGTAVPYIKIDDIKNINVKIPPLSEQRAIASIFPPIEDKIELLRQENETLEAMAETIFRQWFIEEFDSLGQCTINDLCSKIATGGTPLTHVESYYNGNINWFTTKELNDNFLYDSEKKITEEGLKNSSAKLFPPGTVLIAIYAAPTVGKLGILKKEAAFNQATCGLVADESICCPEFLYFYLKSQRNNLISMATGSVQQNLSVSKIRSYPAFKATKEKIDKFQEIIQPFLDKIFFNKQQLQTLSQLFDTLLHGLMSGELRVDDALCQS